MFLMVSYMLQKYMTLAYDIYDGCLCHIWRCLVSYMTFVRVIYDVCLCHTWCLLVSYKLMPYLTMNSTVRLVLFSAPLSRFLLSSLFFFVGNAYSPFRNLLHVFLEYFTFCHSEKKLSFYTVN